MSMVERCEWFRDPIGRVRQRQQQVDEAVGRLQLATARATSRRRSLLHGLEVRLLGVRPEAILARRRELLTKVEHRLQWVIGRLHLNAERRLREAYGRLSVVSPGQGIDRNRLLLDQLTARLGLSISRVLIEKQRSVEAFAARLAASSSFCFCAMATSSSVMRLWAF